MYLRHCSFIEPMTTVASSDKPVSFYSSGMESLWEMCYFTAKQFVVSFGKKLKKLIDDLKHSIG